MHNLSLRGVSALALLFGLAVAPTAVAQETQTSSGPQTAPQSAPEQRGDVVVVTAQKREETVQDIAVAVTAVTDTMREEIGLTTLTDFTNFAPGLSFSVANDRIGMRGVNRNTNTFGIRTGISNYVDGVYYPSSIIATASRRPIFVDRTEVVRGPQGTLYGRDSIGGALNVISKRPEDEFGGQFNIGAGSYDTMHTEFAVTGPISDSVRYRVVGARDFQGEGYLKNKAGLDSEGLRTDGYNYEVQLEGEFGDLDWFARAGHIYWAKNGAPGARTNAGARQEYDTRFFTSGALAPNSAYGYIAPSFTQVGSFIGNPAINDPYAFNADTTSIATLTGGDDAALEMIYHAPGFDVKYLGGYGFYKYDFFADNDGTPVTSFQTRIFPFTAAGTLATVKPGRTTNYNEQRAWFSNEVNFLSTYDGPVQFIAGLYQYQENFSQPIYVYYNNPPVSPTVNRVNVNPITGQPIGVTPGQPAPTRLGQQLSTLTGNTGITDSYGIFTQADWQLTDEFKVTGGLRYSTDFSRIEERGRIMCYYTATCAAAGANAARPGVDATDQAFFGVSPLFPQGAPGVIDATPTNPSGAFTDPLTGDRTRRLADDWSAITGMARVDWTPNSDTLVFFNYARGYKGGGFNAGGSFAPIPKVDKETIDSYEIGWKQEIPSWFLTVNTDAFFYDYRGYQVPNTVAPLPDPITGFTVPPFNTFVNLPKLEFTGFEIETSWSPTDDFTLLANYGYVNPEIKEARGIDGADPLARLPGANPIGPVIGARYNAAGQVVDGQVEQDLAGNIAPLTPKNKVSVNARYTFDFEGGSSLTASATYNWQDSTYSSIFNSVIDKAPSWDQVNARLLWTSSDGNWTLIGFIENLFDTKQYESVAGNIRRSDAVPAATTAGGALTSTARTIPQTLSFCGSSPATSINAAGNGGNGSLAESCLTQTETYRMPRWGGVELQFRF
jgi:iron complex outermembrane recepter protein